MIAMYHRYWVEVFVSLLFIHMQMARARTLYLIKPQGHLLRKHPSVLAQSSLCHQTLEYRLSDHE